MLQVNDKKITKIDHRIVDLHAQLTTLYQDRLHAVACNESTLFSQVSKSEEWVKNQYETAKDIWALRGVAVPDFTVLKSKFQKACEIMEQINTDASLQNKFSLLLVPPSSKYVTDNDQTVGQDTSSLWKLYVVFSDKLGMTVNNFDALIKNKFMMVAGYEMHGLNSRQYTIFTELVDTIYDKDSWSLLVSEATDPLEVSCVSYIGNRYQYSTDDVRSLLGDNRFRPAMELK